MHKVLPILALLSITAFPTIAYAHAPSPGMQGFWLGAKHPILTIMQMPALVGLGLRLGQLNLSEIRYCLVALLAASLLGVGLGLLSLPFPWWQEFMLGLAIAVAVIAIVGQPKSPFVIVALTGLIGLAAGHANAPETDGQSGVFVTTLGAYISMNLIVVMIASGMDYARETITASWVNIGIRILASWTAVIALLLLMMQITPST